VTALPANLIQTVVRAKPEQMDAALLSRTWAIGEQTCPYFSLSHLLRFPAASLPASLSRPSSQLPPSLLLLRSASQTIALGVDEVLGNQEAVVKNLGPQLSQMPGLAGMTVLPTGQTVLIYNPVALATVYGAQSAALAQQGSSLDSNQGEIDSVAQSSALIRSPIPAPLAPLVMVVDDSITMRRVLQRLLVREGYRTTQAADGKQALDMLRIERPALVLSDVEMPRMDGFELLKQIRSSEKLQDLPVVMITSRIADKHRDYAKSLGANEYLGKPYPEEELILLLRQYAPV
jgi:chemosensory pili system protein ChpA (sensor histidine kinase/response regulator)